MAKKLTFSKLLLYALMCIILFILPLQSQTNGRIAGKIIDKATEEPLAGANVIVKGTFMGSASDVDGYFAVLNIPPGEYEVEASMVGYTTVMKTEIQVALERTTQISFELEEATLEGETVVIVAERDILHKEVSSAQQVITSIQIESAAGVNNLNEFIGAQAGITDSRLLEIRGGSADQTGSLVNGLSFVNIRIGKAEASIPLSAVEQVSLQSGGYAAEYGNFRSGLINITTKSGEKNEYHGSFNYTRNTPAQKRFGKSLYDPDNYFLKTTFDPVLAFEGANQETWEKLTGDSAEAAYRRDQYSTPSWRGWNNLVDRYNGGRDPEDQVSTMDLYLWNAWMHMIVPDFDKLEEMYPELTTENPTYNDPNAVHYRSWDEIKSAFRKHEAQKEGENADWDLDLGFGGPVPFVSSALGDATFFLSHKSTNSNYVQPVMREGEKTNITMLTLKSSISQNLSFKVHGLYRFIRGTQSNFPTDGDIPDIDEGGDTMPIQNLGTLLGSNPGSGSNAYGASMDQYAYHPTFWQPKDQKNFMGGITINQIINDKTFLDVILSYAYQLDKFEPEETRNSAALVNFGPIWMNERPYGITFAPDTVFHGDAGEYFAPDAYEAAYQITRRHASKVGQFHENSVTQQFKFKVDFSNQYNRSNFFKSGVELNYYDIDSDNYRWWYGHDTIYEMRDRRKPYQLGYYIQDQISLESMEARIGVRIDYYNSGGGVWPTDKYNEDAFGRGTEGDNQNQLEEDLKAGNSVIWDRWRAIDDSLGGTFLEKTKNHVTFSPRLGIAFPITESAKFFFNYGHFRSPVPYSQQFFYKMRFFKNGLSNIGNPNLEPPRTISYELGLAYNLLNNYLIELSTYYKDVSGESAQVNYHNEDNTLNYAEWLNNRWEDDMGFELKVTKNSGKYLTGWLNFWYVIDKNGRVGAQHIWEQEEQNTPDQFYGGDENSPSLSPKIAANVTLHTPVELGPEYVGIHPLGDWRLSLFPRWERGSEFTFNPANTRNLQNNLRWPDHYNLDLKLSIAFNIAGVTASIFLDVRNASLDDKTKYLKSLRLPEYKDRSDYPESTNPNDYVSGNDKVGDLRSDDKPYIDDPDVKMFLYGNPRQVWFGLKLSF